MLFIRQADDLWMQLEWRCGAGVPSVFVTAGAGVMGSAFFSWLIEYLQIWKNPANTNKIIPIKNKDMFLNQNVGLIFSGGNADIDDLPW